MIRRNAHRQPWMCVVVALASCAVIVLGLMPVLGQSPPIATDGLGVLMGFSSDDRQSADSGSAVIRSLDTLVREEVAYIGMVSIDAPVDRFIQRFRDIEEFERGSGTPQIGLFSDPPRMEDLAALKLPPADVAALQTCRPGNCAVKLSAAAMQRFRDDVDWSAENAAAGAEQVAREMILDLVLRYRSEGNAALGQYDDGDDPVSVADEVRGLVASTDTVPTPVPALLSYLDSYPDGRPAGVEDFFYWTLVDFGLKRTVRVNHVTIYRLEETGTFDVAYVTAIKQLYASHYFYTTLELRFLIRVNRGLDSAGTRLISITRSRNDGMTGLRGLFLRPIIRRRSRDAVRGYLDHVKHQVERPLSEGRPGSPGDELP